MEQFITVAKSSPDFDAYMSGRFSKTHVAIPIQNFDNHIENSRVTFEILERKANTKTRLAAAYFRLMRFELLPLTLGAMLSAVALANGFQNNLVFFMLISLVFVHAGIFALNDYRDYLSGVDRIRKNGGTRVLIGGHVAAFQVKSLSIVLILVGFIFAIPVFLHQPFTFAYALAVAVFALLFIGKLRAGISSFLLFGPLLVSGAAIGTGVGVKMLLTKDWLFLSCLGGAMACLYLHARQFSTVFDDHMAKVKTIATRIGFDRTRYLLFFEVLLCCFLAASLQKHLFSFVTVSVASLILFYFVYRTKTPVSSFAEKLPIRVLVYASFIYTFLISGF